jgi:hypothetical protein
MKRQKIKRTPEPIFSAEELNNISGLCDVLFQIRQRLIKEGKIKVNKQGKIIKIYD